MGDVISDGAIEAYRPLELNVPEYHNRARVFVEQKDHKYIKPFSQELIK
ncbi:hypothetical protein PHYNN_13 [Pantoea phage Phynn]|nr:hypothetical protein PHYNN_13 [Pantoea phage Phynn]